MKKLIINTLIVFAITSTPVFSSQAVKVSAVNDFTTVSPTKTLKVIAQEHAEFKNGIVFENGGLIIGEVIDVKQPKRGKRNASFKFKPISYTYNGKTTKIADDNFIGKYKEYKELNKGEVATKAATTAGGLILNIPLFSQGVSLIKGMWKNKEDNRIKSGVVQVYKDSPLTYVEEGKDVIIKEDDIFIFKFKTSESEDFDEQDTNNENDVEYIKPVANTKTIEGKSTSIPSTFTEKHPEQILEEVLSKTK